MEIKMETICFSKKELMKHIQASAIKKYSFKTPAGNLLIQATDRGIFHASFMDKDDNQSYVQLPNTTMPLLLGGTPLQLKVWQELLRIESDRLMSYQELAARVGQPKAHRAVANAVGNNEISYFIPCHRIIRKDGSLGGYRWGLERKKTLLQNLTHQAR